MSREGCEQESVRWQRRRVEGEEGLGALEEVDGQSHRGPSHHARMLRFCSGDVETLHCSELVVISIK